MATVAGLLRSNEELGSQLLSRAPKLLTYALVPLIGLRAAFLVAQLAGSTAPEPPPATPPPAIATASAVDIPSVLRANIFGKTESVLDTRNAPVTSMSLTLGGVVTAFDARRGLDPKLGWALIGTSAADVKVYRVGAMVPGGAQLHEVHTDRVLLNRDGAIEALLLPQRAGTAALAPPPASVAFGSATQVQRVQQVMRENPTLINQVISRTPSFSGGKLQGMRVNPGANRPAFDKLGLKPNDLVTAINGVQLNDQTRVDEIFNSLSTASEAQVTVERNGTRQELRLNLAEIASEAEKLAQGTANTGPVQPGPDSAR
jgi:general secretion pathway protein C